MKRLFLISAVAIAAVTAASCQKEFMGNDDNTNTPESSQLRTFTATIAAPEGDTKAAIADDGRFTFTAGDFIYVFNRGGVLSGADITFTTADKENGFNYGPKQIKSDGSSWGTGDIVAESIKITSEMISNDGKTLTFTTSVAEPADGGKWYFLLGNGGGSWRYLYLRDTDAWTRFIVEKDKIVCYASIDKASFNGSIVLKHSDSQFRFKVSNISEYNKVTITPNSGSVTDANCISAVYTARPAANDYGIYGRQDVSVTLSADDASKVYYVGVVPNRTWAGGITFHLWKDDVEVKTLKISKDITIGVGDIIDFGDLAKVNKDNYTSLYAKYNDGYDINVGGVVVNKATYGNATYLENGATLSGTDNKGVFFVAKGATISYTSAWARLFEGGDAILIGDATDGSRSTLQITGGGLLSYLPSGAYGVAFKNIDIESTATQPLFNAGSGSKVSWLIFDNCKFTGVVGALFLDNNFARNIGKIVFKDSEFRISKANTYFLQSTACTVDEYVVDNCIFYPETDGSLLSNPVIFACLASSITITNNTFVNLHPTTQLFGNNGTTYPANFAPKIGNNLRYYTVAPASGKTAIFHLGWTGVSSVNLYPNAYYIKGGNVNGAVFHAVYSVDSADEQYESDPFTKADFANGVFVNTTTYGAKR